MVPSLNKAVQDWVARTLGEGDVAGKKVLEVGSYDVNGSVRPYVESLGPATYLGVDAGEGPGVDKVVDCERLTEEVGRDWDVVISTEMIEHVRNWRTCMTQLVDAVTPDGLLLITTRSPDFPYHPFPEDHWRYTPDTLGRILDAFELTATIEMDPLEPGVFAVARKTPAVRYTAGRGARAALLKQIFVTRVP